MNCDLKFTFSNRFNKESRRPPVALSIAISFWFAISSHTRARIIATAVKVTIRKLPPPPHAPPPLAAHRGETRDARNWNLIAAQIEFGCCLFGGGVKSHPRSAPHAENRIKIHAALLFLAPGAAEANFPRRRAHFCRFAAQMYLQARHFPSVRRQNLRAAMWNYSPQGTKKTHCKDAHSSFCI